MNTTQRRGRARTSYGSRKHGSNPSPKRSNGRHTGGKNRFTKFTKHGERPQRSQHSHGKTHGRPNSRPNDRPSGRPNRRPLGRPNSRPGGGHRGQNQPTFDPTHFISNNPVREDNEVAYVPTNTFGTFGLSQGLLNDITRLGISIPTPIQDKSIPHILKGRDIVGLAETGTGKTAAFLIPLIEHALQDERKQALVIAPTRELALQIHAELQSLSQKKGLYSTVCVGGMNINPQIRGLRKRNHFVIGTPGRLLDLIRQKYLRPEQMSAVVLDEADRMLDMGFINDVRKILETTPKNRQTLFFSATMSGDIRHLIQQFLKEPLEISVKKNDVTTTISQDIVPFQYHNKFKTLTDLLGKKEVTRTLVFGSKKHSVNRLCNELIASGVSATSIHGNKSHSQRQRALAAFKNGEVRVLVATDVAARGIHVENISHVINYDLPTSFEDYVHRIGRTGRGKDRGVALTFVQK